MANITINTHIGGSTQGDVPIKLLSALSTQRRKLPYKNLLSRGYKIKYVDQRDNDLNIFLGDY